jgi:hypothetical protein
MDGEKRELYGLRAQAVLKALPRRGIQGHFAQDSGAAVPLILSLIKEGSSVAWGGSMTLARDLKLYDAIRQGPYKAIDRDAAKTPEESERLHRESFSADCYLMGCNAVSASGELVNVDANGNRAAALLYGPRRVILALGCNKICPDLDAALARAREEAAPPNSIRLKKDTPCRLDGHCHDCLSADCICCHTVITRKSRTPDRIHLVLIGEDLGF